MAAVYLFYDTVQEKILYIGMTCGSTGSDVEAMTRRYYAHRQEGPMSPFLDRHHRGDGDVAFAWIPGLTWAEARAVEILAIAAYKPCLNIQDMDLEKSKMFFDLNLAWQKWPYDTLINGRARK